MVCFKKSPSQPRRPTTGFKWSSKALNRAFSSSSASGSPPSSASCSPFFFSFSFSFSFSLSLMDLEVLQAVLALQEVPQIKKDG